MGLRSGFPLLYQQFKALFRKNLLLSWRNKRATFLQLFSSFIFIFLIFCIQKAIEARNASSTAYKSVADPPSLVSLPIPPCEDKYYIKTPCFDFVWSGDGSSRIQRIVSAIMDNNPGRPIPASKVKSFRTTAEVDAWLYSNPMHCPGALHFLERNATVISYGIQTNSTPVAKRGQYEDPTFKFQIPLQIAAEREIARSLIGVPNFSWVVAFKEFAHPAMELFSALDTVGPTFFLATAMFGFVFQMTSLITEKELKLRQAMTMMGLYDTAYWFSWLAWEGIITLLSSLFIVLFGMMFQFDFFLKNNFAVLFLVFFLFQLNMLGFAFMLSAFISKSSSSTTVGFSIFIVGFMTQLVTAFGFPYSDSISRTFRSLWSLFPPNLLAIALQILAGATSTPQDIGVSWSRRTKCAPNDDDCVITINDIYIWLVATFFLWFVLAIYFDNIIPNASGVRKSVFYFLKPGYWIGKGGNKVEEGGICSCIGSVPPQEQLTPDDEDVLEEENIVKQQTREGIIDPNIAVQIRGLVKTYPGTTNIGCCRCTRTSPYHALKGLWVNFSKDQLFCLLGPNGAGKTTAINCLTGITPVTGGDALIYGYSARSSVGMAKIRKMIGVCPQFDILWDALSGQEHLHLFASIKGLSPASIKSVAKKSLAEVRLTEAAKMRAGSYSGGMKRRLSFAIALIGDPKLVILDEPTTGMDPITRRHVWDIIEDTKKGRAIVLTTHSMEEADILSDRIGIMAKGRLRCIGTSIRLKSRFGTGFIANVSFTGSTNGQSPPNSDAVATPHHEAVKQFFKHHLDVLPKEERVFGVQSEVEFEMESSAVLGGLQPNFPLCPSHNTSSTPLLRLFSTSHSSPSLSVKLQKQLPLASCQAASPSPFRRCATLSNTFLNETSELADIEWDNLGFAFLPTDYMYVMKCAQGENFSKGELQRFGNIELSPSAGVLNYGQGLFEGMKAYRKQDGNILLFRPEENALRMRLGAERMCMPSPSVEQFVEAVKATVLANKRWVPPPGKGSLYIRPLLMGSGAVLGLAPAPEYTFLIYVSPVGNYFKEGVAPINLIVEHELHRATPGGTGGVKTIGNYAAVLKAQSAAKAKGYSDVLYLDCVHKRYLEEVSSCNIFVVKDNIISTPEIKGTILPGITRKSIIDVARSEGFQVEERQVAVDELLDADEVFCTGTAVVVSPVGSITYHGKRVSYGEGGFGAVSERLYSVLTRLQMGLTQDKLDWTVELRQKTY